MLGAGVLGSMAPVAVPADALHAHHLPRAPIVAQSDRRSRYDIAAGPLPAALAAFEKQSGITISSVPGLFDGKRTQGVIGTLTRSAALARLLAGTGLTFEALAKDAVRVVATPATSTLPALLPGVSVHGGESGGTYGMRNSLLRKQHGPLVDIPQSVTVVSAQVLQDRNATTMREALRNVSGISIAAGEGGTQGDSITIRGFDARDDFYLDGMRDFGNYYRDTFDIESIEVDEGPSGSLFGRGSAGGAIDQRSKAPRLIAFDELEATGGSDNTARLTDDANIPLSAHSALRVNAMMDHSDVAERDVAQNNRWGAAFAYETGIGQATSFTFDYMHMTQSDVPDYGLPLLWGHPADVDRSNFYGFKDGNTFDEKADVVTATVKHRISANVSLTNQVRYATYNDNFLAANAQFSPEPPVGRPLQGLQVGRTIHARVGTNTYVDDQTDVTAVLGQHTVVAGLEIGDEGAYQDRPKYAGLPWTSLLDPNDNQPLTYASITHNVTNAQAGTLGLYALDTMRLGEYWLINSGLRYDNFDATMTTIGTPGYVEEDDNRLGGKAAVTYKPSKSASIYLAYGSSFDPTAEALAVNGVATPPESSQGYQLGTKWNALGNRLSLDGALFAETQSNVRETDPSGVIESIGQVKTRGASAQLSGSVTQRWKAIAGVTLMTSDIATSAIPAEVGNPMSNAPNLTASLWNTYQTSNRLEVGGGFSFVGRRNATNKPDTLVGFVPNAPGYWRFDAMAKYRVDPKLALQLNVFNLTNAFYYDQMYSDHIVPGPGRSFQLSTDVKL